MFTRRLPPEESTPKSRTCFAEDTMNLSDARPATNFLVMRDEEPTIVVFTEMRIFFARKSPKSRENHRIPLATTTF